MFRPAPDAPLGFAINQHLQSASRARNAFSSAIPYLTGASGRFYPCRGIFDLATTPDITDTEQWVLRTTLRERYGRDLELQLADAEIRLHASDCE